MIPHCNCLACLVIYEDEYFNSMNQSDEDSFVEASVDGGVTWGICSGFVSEQEAISIKRSIDHNTFGLTIDVRVSKMQ